MPAVLYRKERELLNYIIQFQEQYGYSPTLREIGEAVGKRSPSTIHSIIRSLVDKGYVQKVDGNTRTLKVLQQPISEAGAFGSAKAAGPSMSLPLMGYIVAGKPLEPHVDPGATFDVASSMLSGRKTAFVLQVRGNSMIEDGIFDGDFVVIEKSNTARNGDIVVALVDDNLVTLKKFYKEQDRIVLMPANSEMDPIYPTTVKIQGLVVGLVRRFIH